MKPLLSILSLLVLASTAPAAVLVTFPFSGSTTGNIYDPTSTNTLLNPTGVATNMTASNITQAGAIAWRFQTGTTNMSIYPGNTAVNSSTATGTALTTATGTATATDAVAQGSYFTFTITADPGYELDMTSLTFDVARGGAGTRGFAIQTSATGFSTNGSTNLNSSTGAVAAGASTAVTTNIPTYTGISMDLSGAAYQNLTSLEVRVYSYSGAVNSSLEYDNFVLNGTVSAVPEPATWGMMACAGTMFMVMRRRRI